MSDARLRGERPLRPALLACLLLAAAHGVAPRGAASQEATARERAAEATAGREPAVQETAPWAGPWEGLPCAAELVEVRPAEPFVPPPAELLRERRRRLMDSVGSGVVILRSAGLRDIESDYPQDSDFRQDNDFLYLTGLESPDSWLVLVGPRSGPRREVLFVPRRDPARERWTGPMPSLEEAEAASGIGEVRWAPELGSAVGLPEEAGLPHYLNARAVADETLRRVLGETVPIREAGPLMARLRLVKDDHEIRLLRRAAEITAGGLRAAIRAARPAMYEYVLEAIVEFNFRLGGAERVGFPSIVGSGPNSVVLHYDRNRRAMEAGDLVVMDVGAEYSYYTADVTRTIPVSGRFTERQRTIYDLVLGAQRAALDAVRPGATMREAHLAAVEYLRNHSRGACGIRACDAYFVHGVGHWLGMDVHDVGDYATPFRPGMVLTVEPGIYLAEEGLGIRIEDDVLVTPSGYEILSDGVPREAEEIEALIAEGRERAVGQVPRADGRRSGASRPSAPVP